MRREIIARINIIKKSFIGYVFFATMIADCMIFLIFRFALLLFNTNQNCNIIHQIKFQAYNFLEIISLIIIVFILHFLLKSNYSAAFFSLLIVISLFIDLFSVVVCKITSIPLTLTQFLIIKQNLNITSLNAVIGSLWWFLLFAILLMISILFYVHFSAMKYLCKLKVNHYSNITIYALGVISIFLFIYLSWNRPYSKDDQLIYYRNPHELIMGIIEDNIDYSRRKRSLTYMGFYEKNLSSSHKLLIEKHTGYNKDIGHSVFLYKKIIIVAVESLNLKFIRYYNKYLPDNITDNLDVLCKSYVSFENYYSATAPTTNGLHAIITSRLLRDNDLNRDIVSIADVLREKGYKSIYISGVSGKFADTEYYFKNKYHFDYCWCNEHLSSKIKKTGKTAWGTSDHSVFEFAYNALTRFNDDKFLCLISTIDTHPPFISPTDSPKSKFDTPLLNAINRADCDIGRFVNLLINSGYIDDDTLLVLTADHACTFRQNLATDNRIPLILITKNNKISEYFKNAKNVYASSIDLAPTLLYFVDVDIPKSFMGVNILNRNKCSVSYVNASFFIHSTKEESMEIMMDKKNFYDALSSWFNAYYNERALKK